MEVGEEYQDVPIKYKGGRGEDGGLASVLLVKSAGRERKDGLACGAYQTFAVVAVLVFFSFLPSSALVANLPPSHLPEPS